MDLVQLTLNNVDENYHILATTLSYGANTLTFDDLRAKLMHHEQRLKFLKSKGAFITSHQALIVSTASTSSMVITSTSSPSNNRGRGQGGNHGHDCYTNRRGAGRNQGGGSRNHNHTSSQSQSSNRSASTGAVYGNTVFSCSNIQGLSSSVTHPLLAGNNSSEGALGSHPNVVCQIYFTLGHTTSGCPNHYLPRQHSSYVPAYATFNAVKANESV